MMSEPSLPLDGLRILDVCTGRAGLFAGQLLGDLGAEVVRVETEPTEANTSVGDFDAALRRSTRVVAADSYDDPEFEGYLRQLAQPRRIVLADADSVVCRARDRGWLRAVLPDHIICTVSRLGADNVETEETSDDLIIQALTGVMAVTGEPGRPPIRIGPPLLDLVTGAYAACLMVAADCRATYRPLDLEVSCFDATLSLLTYMAPMYLTAGQVPGPVGAGHPTIYPYDMFDASDRPFVVAAFTQAFWRNLCRALDKPHWIDDTRFHGFKERLENHVELGELLRQEFATKPRAEWMAVIEAGNVPCGEVHSIREVLQMEQVADRQLIIEHSVDRPGIRSIGSPFHITYGDGSKFAPTYKPHASSVRTASYGRSEPVGGAVHADESAMWADPPMPLKGIRVLDLTRMASGPFCTELLADLGAEVWKIEEPRIGDPTRRNLPLVNDFSTYFYAFNRGKKSIALDLKSAIGVQSVLALSKEVDVLVENFRPGVMDRLGLSNENLCATNPRLAVVSISGFGQTGPLKYKSAFDLVSQAMAGYMSVTGEPDRPPVRCGVAIGDLATGLLAALAAVVGLFERARSDRGSNSDLIMHDAMVVLLGEYAQQWLSRGEEAVPLGSEHQTLVPSAAFMTQDDYLVICAGNDDAWARLVKVLGDDSLSDVTLRSAEQRRAQREFISQHICAILRSRPREEWLTKLRKAGVPCAPVCTLDEALESTRARRNGMIVENLLPGGDWARTVGSPFRVNGRTLASSLGPPGLGQHSNEVPSIVREANLAYPPTSIGPSRLHTQRKFI